jgi:hypothetical protein
MAENVDLSLLTKLAQDNLAEMKAVRREVADIRTLALQTADYMRKMEQRLDARIVGVRDDLELLLKSELMGSLAHFETRMENLLHERLAEPQKTD